MKLLQALFPVLLGCALDLLIGDPSKAKRQLGWQPKTTFAELARIMVDADVEALAKESGERGDQP